MSDEAILELLGQRLERYRLDRNQTQAQVAREAGVHRRTVIRAEKGESITLSMLIRLLRVYGLLERLDALVPAPVVSPIALLEAGGKQRRRASGRGERGDAHEDEPWSWGES